MAKRTWNLLSVPIDSVGLAGGTELAPAALLEAGLAEAIPIGRRAETAVQLRDPSRDAASGVVANEAVIELTAELRAVCAELLAERAPLLVLGGCCTLVPGVLRGLADAGRRAGVVYVDGHLDLYDGTNSVTGEAADMPLAVALGRGPDGWTRAAGGAVLSSADLAILGFRDTDEARGLGSLLPDDLGSGTYIDTPALREAGMAETGARLASELAGGGRDGFWVHVDLDVLDESHFPATDAFVAGGLDWPELAALVAPLLSDPSCLGLDVVCFNPEKDPGGDNAKRIVELLGQTVD